MLLRSGALDLISNLPLAPVIELHKQRRKTHNSIMTTIVKRLPPSHRSRPSSESFIYVTQDKFRLVSLHALTPAFHKTDSSLSSEEDEEEEEEEEEFNPKSGTPLFDFRRLPFCRFHKRKALEFHVGGQCSLEVLALFTENFDYQDIKIDFFNGISASDILSYQFSIYPITESYFSVVNSIVSLHVTSRDILQRWCYPIVPDIPMLSFLEQHLSLFFPVSSSKAAIRNRPSYKYSFRRYGNSVAYIGEKVIIGTGVKIEGFVMIGANSIINSGSKLINCVIGPKCILNSDSTIKNSILFSNEAEGSGCCIGSKATIEKSLLAPGTQIENGVRIYNGAIIGTWTPKHHLQIAPSSTKIFNENPTTVVRVIGSSMLEYPHTSMNHPIPQYPIDASCCISSHLHPSAFISSDEEDSLTSSPLPLLVWNNAVKHKLGLKLKEAHHSQEFQDDGEGERGEDESNHSRTTIRQSDLRLSEYMRMEVIKKDDWTVINEPLFFSNSKIPWSVQNVEIKRKGHHHHQHHRQRSNSTTSSSTPVVSPVTGAGSPVGTPPLSTPQQTSFNRTQFCAEVSETLRHALDYVEVNPDEGPHNGNIKTFVENTCVEINALKFAFNANFDDVRRAVIPLLVRHTMMSDQGGSSSRRIQQILEQWLPLFNKINHGDDAQSEILSLVLETCTHSRFGMGSFRWIIHNLYQLDVLEEEDILSWWSKAMDPSCESSRNSVLLSLSQFIDWLGGDEG